MQGGIENNILYAPWGTLKAYVHQLFQILNSTDWIGTELSTQLWIFETQYLSGSDWSITLYKYKARWPQQEPQPQHTRNKLSLIFWYMK